MWPFSKKQTPASDVAAPTAKGVFSTDTSVLGALVERHSAADINYQQPAGSFAQDEHFSPTAGYPLKGPSFGGVPDSQLMWYASQSFIGYQACAVIGTHWLVDKACTTPAEDALRMGYQIDCDSAEAVDLLNDVDEKYQIDAHMKEYIAFGRVFGVRVALFVVESTDPEYYIKPFNPDGVAPGSYRGISQIDPQWVTPVLTDANLSNPAGKDFYLPLFYRIGNQVYHRSHLSIYIPYPVTDTLKPMYQFGGVSVPQRIYERVYAAERSANEVPQLLMTKRLTNLTLPEEAFNNPEALAAKLQEWIEFRDNYGVRAGGASETISQIDTSLADLPSSTMLSYQLVAACAGIPATKLIETTPIGFASSGEYESESYRQVLESVQKHLDPMLKGHYLRMMRSDVAPSLGVDPMKVGVKWAPLDSPTAAEAADVALKKAQTDQIYVAIQAIDGQDVRTKLKDDEDSQYQNLADIEDPLDVPQGNVDPLTGEPVAETIEPQVNERVL